MIMQYVLLYTIYYIMCGPNYKKSWGKKRPPLYNWLIHSFILSYKARIRKMWFVYVVKWNKSFYSQPGQIWFVTLNVFSCARQDGRCEKSRDCRADTWMVLRLCACESVGSTHLTLQISIRSLPKSSCRASRRCVSSCEPSGVMTWCRLCCSRRRCKDKNAFSYLSELLQMASNIWSPF